MPAAILNDDRAAAVMAAKFDPKLHSDITSLPCPLFSGHLLKLGPSGQWQARLFTFDGKTLVCASKRAKAANKDTSHYSPFITSSSTTSKRSTSMSGKWSLDLASMTSIRLLSSPYRNVRCFTPYTETPRTLSITLNDGRNLLLRAKKEIDLQRWFFVLSKIWSLHLLISSSSISNTNRDQTQCQSQSADDVSPAKGLHATATKSTFTHNEDEPQSSHCNSYPLPTRKKSMQIIHKYLHSRRHQRRVLHPDRQQSRRSSQGQVHNQVQGQDQSQDKGKEQSSHHRGNNENIFQMVEQNGLEAHVLPSSRYRLIPLPMLNAGNAGNAGNTASKSKDSGAPQYQIPAPPRISRFLPQGFEWDLPAQHQQYPIHEDTSTKPRPRTLQERKTLLDFERDGDRHESRRISRHLDVGAKRDDPRIRRKMSSGAVQQGQGQERRQSQGQGLDLAVHPLHFAPQSQDFGENPDEGGHESQGYWPGMVTLAPEKAAAIDAWRRSLLSPLMMGDESSFHSDDSEHYAGRTVCPKGDQENCEEQQQQMKHCERNDETPISKQKSHALVPEEADPSADWVHFKDEFSASPLTAPASERKSCEDSSLPMPGQSSANRPRYHQQIYALGKDDGLAHTEPSQHHLASRWPSNDLVVQQMTMGPSSGENKFNATIVKDAEESLPLSLLKLNRYSRWQKTQLSSEDGASKRDSYPTLETMDALLPPAPITPKQSNRDHHVQGAEQAPLPSTRSDPSLRLHGSSYSHLPIHDPDFVYPRDGQQQSQPKSQAQSLSSRRPSYNSLVQNPQQQQPSMMPSSSCSASLFPPCQSFDTYPRKLSSHSVLEHHPYPFSTSHAASGHRTTTNGIGMAMNMNGGYDYTVPPLSYHPLQQTRSPPHSLNSASTAVESGQQQRFAPSRSLPSLQVLQDLTLPCDSITTAGGYYNRQDVTTRYHQHHQQPHYHQQHQHQHQQKIQYQQGPQGNQSKEQDDDDEDENEPLAQMRTRRQESLKSQRQLILAAAIAAAAELKANVNVTPNHTHHHPTEDNIIVSALANNAVAQQQPVSSLSLMSQQQQHILGPVQVKVPMEADSPVSMVTAQETMEPVVEKAAERPEDGHAVHENPCQIQELAMKQSAEAVEQAAHKQIQELSVAISTMAAKLANDNSSIDEDEDDDDQSVSVVSEEEFCYF
ncbi:hypothetical protein BGZ94_007664 [Podila epigama]|nr:hypothetical protein BGZ94_007664 [Podila epigama]